MAAFWTCRACRVDVSVPEEVRDPGCPRCFRPLERAAGDEGEAPDRTVIMWRAPPASEASTNRSFNPIESAGPLSASVSASDAHLAESVTGSFRPRGFGPDEPLPDPIPVPQPTLAVGARFGPFVLEGVLGKGGMGIVYRAHQPALKRQVALKVLTTAHADDEDRERFMREARAAARLKHPNIVPVLEVGSVDGRDYFTMDLVEGTNLHEAARRRRLSPEQSYEIVRKVALAVDHAHQQGIIHRDLKPGNVLLDRNDEPCVTDFGLAKDLAQGGPALTVTGVALGSPPYMPPEQARGHMKDVDSVSDVYSIGAILYECLTGEPPFTGQSLYEIVAKVQNEEVVPPRKKNPDVSVDAETIVLRCLEKEKWRRYPTAAALARDLERLIRGEPIHAIRAGLTTRMAKRFERHRVQIVSVVFALIPFAGLGAFAYEAATRKAAAPPSSTTALEPDAPGPLEEAARDLEEGEGFSAAKALLRYHETTTDRVPSWKDVYERIRALPPSVARVVSSSLETVLSAGLPASDAKLDLERDGRARLEAARLVVASELADAGAGQALRALFAPRPGAGDVYALERLPERLHEILLATRAFTSQDEDARALFARVFARERSPLEVALGRMAAKRLGAAALRALDARVADLLGPVRPLPGRALETGALRDQRTGFAFPPVELPRLVQGKLVDPAALCGSGVATDARALTLLHPTNALVARQTDRFVIGWLRFVHVVDGSGRIVRRERLPGRARRLSRAADGAVVVECEPLDPSDRERWGPDTEAAEERRKASIFRVRWDEDEGRLSHEDGQPVRPFELDVLSTFATCWEMRAVANALAPDRALALDPDNPWVRARHALARRDADEAREALEAPELTPAERIELACELDASGFEAEAEAAWSAALRELLEHHAFFPHLAGYAAGDPGLALAAAAEARTDPARAATLRAWACAFAPVLEPRFVARPAPGRVATIAPFRAGARVAPGLGGLDGLTYHRLKLALRFQLQFLGAAGLLATLTYVRCRRQRARDLAKVGVTTAAQRAAFFLRSPGLRLSFAIPNYVGVGDRIAFMLLYLAFLTLFAIQDSGLEAVTRIHRTPPALLAGLPAHPTARRHLEAGARGTYLHALASYVASTTDWRRLCEDLRAEGDARASVLLAFDRPANEREALLRQAARANPPVPEAALMLGEGVSAGLAGDVAVDRFRALGAGKELLPAPAIAERDRAIFEGGARWWSGIGAIFARNCTSPGKADASVNAFRSACPEMLADARAQDAFASVEELRNRYFWLIPMTVLFLLGTLLIPTKRPFSPGPEDLDRKRSIRLLGVAFPGITQYMRGKPVRGVLLGLPFAQLANVLYHQLLLGTEVVPTIFGESIEAAARMVGERPASLALARNVHYFWLFVVLGGIYVIHWIDLALDARRQRLILARSTRGKRP